MDSVNYGGQQRSAHGSVQVMSKSQQLSISVRYRDADGVGLGVLSDGTTYVSLHGLAKLCGVSRPTIQELREDWEPGAGTGRDRRVADHIKDGGEEPPSELAFQIQTPSGFVWVFSEGVAMAVLNYYIDKGNATALFNARRMMRGGFRQFVYLATGYSPGAGGAPTQVPDDEVLRRLELNTTPLGYFSILNEGAGILLEARRAGVRLGPKAIPDISVGSTWASHWRKKKLATIYGERKKYNHTFPDDYPQSRRDEIPANMYPDAALPEFRRWLRTTYATEKLPAYLRSKLALSAATEDMLRGLRTATEDD